MLFVSGNTVLLALSTAFSHLYKDFRQQCNISEFLKPVNYLCVFIAVETTVLAYVMVTYICKLHSVKICTVTRPLVIKKWNFNSFMLKFYVCMLCMLLCRQSDKVQQK